MLFIKIIKNKIFKNIFVFFFIFILEQKVMINLILMLQKLKYLTGNLIKGIKKGKITSDNEIVITANNFEYDKIKNILKANGNVKIKDTIKNYEILTDNAVYFKEDELIITEGNSRYR